MLSENHCHSKKNYTLLEISITVYLPFLLVFPWYLLLAEASEKGNKN